MERAPTGTTDARTVRVFIASPDDVEHERQCVELVVEGLDREFGEIARFVSIRWEQGFYKAHRTFQTQIPEPADCDVVIVIFGGKLGSEMPAEFAHRLPDGSPYPSGTAYELLSSLDAADATERPDVYVFRKTQGEKFDITQWAQIEAAKHEADRLEDFFQRWFRTPTGGFRRAFHPFRNTDEFADKVTRLLSQWAEHTLALAPTWRIDRDGSPFRGLEPFDAKHSRVFFGRNRKVQRAVDELIRAAHREQGRPFLLIVGASGSGKSSLMRAGLAPRLTAPGVVPEVDRWRIAVLRPGGAATPFMALARALYVSADADSDLGGFGAALPELTEGPYKSPEQLVEVLEAARPSAAAPPLLAALDAVSRQEQIAGGFDRTRRTDLLLLVDQLEEIFAADVSDTDRTAFARLLTVLADSGRVWIAATLRADLYVRMLDPHLPFLALKDSGGQYDLASPGEAELTEILQKSAEAAGLEYEKDPVSGERLDEQLLRDAAGADTLPLLEFSLKQLFDRLAGTDPGEGERRCLTFVAYRELGGLDGAIDQVAEAAIADPANQLGPRDIDEALPRLLRQLAVPVRDAQSQTVGRAALTVRAVRLAEAAPTDTSRRLAEILVRARLLVSDSSSRGDASLRLAHERVLTSWKRASQIVQAHRDFYRITDDVEVSRGRWEAGGKPRELLLPAGAPLADAERIVRAYGSELPQQTRDYIAMSGRRARRRQRLVAAAAAVFAVVSVIATGFALIAFTAEQKAARNYAAAKTAADTLVSSIAQELRQQKGISSQTLDIVFAVADGLMQRIQDAANQQQGPVMRQLQAGFDAMEQVVRGTPPAEDDAAALQRSRANMLYQFAETYHQSANDLGKARDKAQRSLAIQQQLLAGGDASPQMRAAIAMTQMELGDIARLEIEQSHPLRRQPLDLSAARGWFEPALGTLEGLYAQSSTETVWALGYSQVLTRLGDLDLNDGKLDSAAVRYARAQAVSLQAFRAAPAEASAMHELAWSYRKSGEISLRKKAFSVASQAIADEVCVRRRLVALKPDDVLWGRDLGWGLIKLGDARMQQEQPDVNGARDAYYEAAHQRLEQVNANSSQKVLFEEFAGSLQSIGNVHRAAGEAELADAFGGAAGDIRQQIPAAFLDEDSLPHDQAQRQMALNQERTLRERGVMAMIEGHRRGIVETAIQAFEVTRLEQLQHDAQGCWARLIETVNAQASAIAAKP